MGLSKTFNAQWAQVRGGKPPPLLEVRERLEPPHFLRAFAGRLFIRRADFVIDTGVSLAETRHAVQALVHALLGTPAP